MESFQKIADRFGVSVHSLKRHWRDHCVRHLQPQITFCNVETDEGFEVEPFIVVKIDGDVYYVPAEILIKEAARRFTICETAEELEKGRQHSAKVREYYEKMGDPEGFKEHVRMIEEQWPGFRAVV